MSSGESTYKFLVDSKPYQTSNRFITGEELRQIAAIPQRTRIFFGEQGKGTPDRQVMRSDRVDLGAAGEEKFYTLEPPSMDIC